VPRRAGAVVAVVLAALWLVVAVALAGALALEGLTLSDDSCRLETIDAQGEVEWQLWPPGERCTYRGATISEPPAWRTALIVAEVVVGLLLLAVWRRSRDVPDPDWTA